MCVVRGCLCLACDEMDGLEEEEKLMMRGGGGARYRRKVLYKADGQV